MGVAAGAGAGWPKGEWKPRLGLGEPRDEWKEVRELSRGGKKGASEGVEGWLDCRAGCGGSGCVCGCWSGQGPKIRGKETVRRRSNVGCCEAKRRQREITKAAGEIGNWMRAGSVNTGLG